MKYITTFIFVFASVFRLFSQAGSSPVKEVNFSSSPTTSIPKPKAPANLIITEISFNDAGGNNNKILDAGENAEILFRVENKGSGKAYSLKAEIKDPKNSKGLELISEFPVGDLDAGKQTTVSVPFSSNSSLSSGKADLEVLLKEANGFDADIFKISLTTQGFKNPIISVADHQFSVDEGGKIKLGQPVTLNVILQNQGQGSASEINIEFINPANVYPANETNFNIANLKPNESFPVRYEFFANKKYLGQEIPVKLVVTEKYKRYGTTVTFTASLEQNLKKTQHISVEGSHEQQVEIERVGLKSDVDKDIPITKMINENKYALIIGNEDYASFQPGINSEMNVEFATNDALTFKEYCGKTLGVPEANIIFKLNATTGQILQGIDKLNKLMKATGGKAEVIVYYAGHGLPDEKTKEPYLIPVDVAGSNISAAIKLSYLYGKLTEFPSNKVCVFMDACFSGGARSQGLVAARGVKITPGNEFLKGNIVVFTASSGDQSSLPWKKQQHGMFTYFLLKQLQESDGLVTLSELAAALKTKVGLESIRTNNKEQNPDVLFSEEVKNKWENWNLK
jgi:hypothetical protein